LTTAFNMWKAPDALDWKRRTSKFPALSTFGIF
jgi:hypothetical protein